MRSAEDPGAHFALSSRMTNPIPQPNSTVQKDPDDWKTGDEPMTPAQRSYLNTLAQDTGETVDENLTKAEASKKIDELRKESPRLAGSKED
jgi:DUF3072 family protein